MASDEIWVEHRRASEPKRSDVEGNLCGFKDCYRSLLADSDHSDVTFIVGVDKTKITGHRAILSCRSEYFRAMFRPGGMMESRDGAAVEVPNYHAKMFSFMLEFIYTDSITDIGQVSAKDIIELLTLANEYLMDDLKKVAVKAAAKLLDDENIGKFTVFSEATDNSELRELCSNYLRSNLSSVRQNLKFRQEVMDCPELALLVVDSIPDESPTKRRRTLDIMSSPRASSALTFHDI